MSLKDLEVAVTVEPFERREEVGPKLVPTFISTTPEPTCTEFAAFSPRDEKQPLSDVLYA